MNRSFRRLLLFVIILSMCTETFAKIAVRAESADATSFQGWVVANAGTQPMSKQAKPYRELKLRLNRTLERAQKRFLNGSLSEARAEFLLLSEMAHLADWSLAQRKAILLSFLRAAQLTDDLNAKRELLHRAAAFSGELKADPKLIPPPLVAEFVKIQKELDQKSISLSVRERFDGYQFLVLNGREYSVPDTDVLHVRPGDHRLSLRSDAFSPISRTISATQLFVFDPPRQPLASGTCESPEWRGEVPYPEAVIYFSDTCQMDLNGGRWEKFSNELPATPNLNWANLSDAKAAHEQAWRTVEKPKAKSLLKSGWFWLGVASVVATSAVLLQQESNRRKSEPEIIPSARRSY